MDLEDWDVFWLSDTPFDVSKYPGAGSRRIATTAHFTGNFGKLTVINTHLDDQSQAQRQLGASLIVHRAKNEAIRTKRPVIVTGDFNSPSHDLAYQTVTGVIQPVALNRSFTEKYSWTPEEEHGFETFVLIDLLGQAPPHRRAGHYATFTDFAAVNSFDKYERLDYVFTGSSCRW